MSQCCRAVSFGGFVSYAWAVQVVSVEDSMAFRVKLSAFQRGLALTD